MSTRKQGESCISNVKGNYKPNGRLSDVKRSYKPNDMKSTYDRLESATRKAVTMHSLILEHEHLVEFDLPSQVDNIGCCEKGINYL